LEVARPHYHNPSLRTSIVVAVHQHFHFQDPLRPVRKVTFENLRRIEAQQRLLLHAVYVALLQLVLRPRVSKVCIGKYNSVKVNLAVMYEPRSSFRVCQVRDRRLQRRG